MARMRRYKIKHVCGHIADHKIFGSNTQGERGRRIAYLATQLCKACWAVEHEEKVQELSVKHKLPELEGSPKQIAWAMSIRGEQVPMLDELHAFLMRCKEATDPHKETSLFDDSLDVVAQICDCTSAKWWIDHRNEDWSRFWLSDQVKKMHQKD